MAETFLSLEERVRLALKIGESHYREFKSAFDGPPGAKVPRDLKAVKEDISNTLVAFANADGGELLIGVEDDHQVTGIPYKETQLEALLKTPENNVLAETPLPSVKKTKMELDGLTILYFSVPKGAQYVHLTSDGRCLRRVDRDTVPVSVEKLQAQRLEDESRRWERGAAVGVTLNDLDIDLVSAVSAQVAYGVSVEKYLQYMELAEFTPDGIRLNRAALLLFAKDITKWYPSFNVRMMIFSSNEQRVGGRFNISYEDRATDNIIKLTEAAWERLNLAISKSTTFIESETKFRPAVMFPQIACREALLNAIVHRNYAIEGRGIEVSIFPDRMEISSPGMLLSTISLEDLKAGSGVHESRNPMIARVLREIGLVREVGEGIRRIQQVMKDSALTEPMFSNSPKGFTITLLNKPLYDQNVLMWLSNFKDYEFSNEQIAVLALGYRGNEFSTQDIMDRLGIVDSGRLPSIINDLVKNGFMYRSKSHGVAMNEARKSKIPKRAVKCYKITDRPAQSQTDDTIKEEALASEELDRNIHRLFLANISHQATKGSIVDFLEAQYRVLQLDLPANRNFPNTHRGFAFVTIASPETLDQIVRKLDGLEWMGRRLHCAPVRGPA